jgi:hypothetical protein
MSLTDKFCNSKDLREEERKHCFEVASYFQEMLSDLDENGYLRPDLESKDNEKRIMDILLNVRKTTNAFNKFFDIYAEKVKPDSKQKLRRFKELGEFIEEELRYLLFSEMIFVFLQNIEEFRSVLLFILKLPILTTSNGKKYIIGNRTTLKPLLSNLETMSIKKVDSINKLIDCDLRNGLSHGLFWFDEKGDNDCSEPHLHYSKDIRFNKISCLTVADLYLRTRKQSIYTNCLLNVIGDWFE